MPAIGLGLEVGDGHREEGDVDRLGPEDPFEVRRHSRRRSPAGAGPGGAGRGRSTPIAPAAGRVGRCSASGSAASRSNRACRRKGSWAEGAWTCQTRGPALQAGLGDHRREAARGDVGDLPDVVDRRDGPAAGHHHVHAGRLSPLLLRHAGGRPIACSAWCPSLPHAEQRSHIHARAATDDDDRPARSDGPRTLRRDDALADLRPPLAHRPASPRRAEPRRGPGVPLLYRTRPLGGDARRPGRRRPRRLASGRRNLAEHLDRIDNTVQYSWLLEIARTFHGFPHDRITPDTIGDLYDRADRERRRGRLGPRGLDQDQARGGLPDQRLRRPARRLGHAASTSPACGPTTWS